MQKQKRNAPLAALAVCALMSGCADDVDPPTNDGVCGETGGGGDGVGCATPIELESCSTLESYIDEDVPCETCQNECHKMYWCQHDDGTMPTGGCPICAENLNAAKNICRSAEFLNDSTAQAVEEPCYLCSNYCSGWDPANEITTNPTNGHIEVDQDFIDSVLADPSKLSSCDSARGDRVATGTGYEITSAVSGDALYELGLRTGDIPLSINSYDLDDLVDVVTAVVALSYSDPSTYTIAYDRNGNTQHITVDVQ